MSVPRRLWIVVLAVVLGVLAAGGSTYLPVRDQRARSAAPRGILPGYGGPVSEQSSGELAPTPLDERVVNEFGADGAQSPNELEAAQAPSRIRGQFMVSLTPGQNTREAAEAIANEYGGEAKLIYQHADSGFLFTGPDDARERLVSDPRVRTVQPDYVMRLAESSAGVHLAAINQPAAVNPPSNFRGAGIRVAILDTGADLNHVDYSNRLEPDSTGFSLSNNVCVKGSYTSAADANGHGTRTVSQAVGAIGVAPDARAVVVKVFPGSSSSTSFSLIKCGVDYVVGLNTDNNASNNVRVVNASIAGGAGAGACNDGGLRQAVCALVGSGAAFFAAAGNSGGSASSYAPGNYQESITLSAFDCDSINCTTTKPKLASFSNRGSAVDLGAPGVAIFSAKRGGGHETASGTSRAAPQAAGAAADLLSAFPALDPAGIRSKLLQYGKCPNTAQNTVAGNCTSGAWTSDSDGIAEPFLNVGQAVNSAPPGPSVPSAPVNVTAAPGNTQATVSWQPPSNLGNPASIDAYQVTSSPGGVVVNVTGSTLSTPVTGLANGTSYTFTVKAHNATGYSVASAPSNAVTPAGAPSPPQNVTATAGNTQATVSWQPPANNGGAAITSYTATSSPGGKTATVAGNQLSAVVAGLTNGQAYTFTVTASNGAATSAPSSPSNSVTPTGPPPSWTRVQENGTGVTYTSGWSSASSSCVSGGSYRYSTATGATADFTFTGIGARLVTVVGPNLGNIEIWVDSGPHTIVELYAPSQQCNQFRGEVTGLASGTHTLHVRVTGTKNASSSNVYGIVDAFERLA